MKWEPSEYDNITMIRVPVQKPWTPGNRHFPEILISVTKIILYKLYLFADIFLANSASADSWNMWSIACKNLTLVFLTMKRTKISLVTFRSLYEFVQ